MRGLGRTPRVCIVGEASSGSLHSPQSLRSFEFGRDDNGRGSGGPFAGGCCQEAGTSIQQRSAGRLTIGFNVRVVFKNFGRPEGEDFAPYPRDQREPHARFAGAAERKSCALHQRGFVHQAVPMVFDPVNAGSGHNIARPVLDTHHNSRFSD